MSSTAKKCSGFPEKAGACENDATTAVLRLPVCEEHARQAEANGHHVARSEKKS